ncbi:MAG TPA: exodeoxyribonuclease VII large subunit, partial [Prolixibacteraceae bacterium]|nr:exodeoxyribonuclease VII large subunit [Prolixibacteraceae bacterium]
MNGQLTLLELNNLIRDALQDAFPETIWVVAEISELKINRTGHCYLELIEKDSVSDDIVARARATIWSYTFRMLKPYFETATGQPFSDGIKVLVLVSVEYHPAYGLSFNIKDIDPTYTVGDLVRRRREIIEKLQEAGVFDMNRELPLPLVPQRIAIISSATAAGYQDFVNQLEHNSYGFIFHHRLFEAFMQGAEAAPSILRALDRIYAEEENFDAVAIIRGGGAQADLSCFDNFELAYTVAQFPLPVVTGIGHEKDDTIIDLVAHTRQKTPTAVAEFFISGAARFYEKLTELQKAVAERTREILESHAETLTNLADDIVHSAGKYLTDSQFRLLRLGQRYKNSVNRYVAQHAENLHR